VLVKVGLSYYMEGEHSQGAKYSKGVSLGAACLGGGNGRERSDGEDGYAFDSVTRVGFGQTPDCERGPEPSQERVAVKAGARRAIRDATWVLGPPGDRRRLCPDRSCCPLMPLGDGWPSLVRAVDAPAVQDVPAWDGTCGLASSGSFQRPAESGGFDLQSVLDAVCEHRRGMWT
jgi:hypothetical protein